MLLIKVDLPEPFAPPKTVQMGLTVPFLIKD